jgi:hypothetical protein
MDTFITQLDEVLFEDGMTRRDFLKRTGSGIAAAATGGIGDIAKKVVSGLSPAISNWPVLIYPHDQYDSGKITDQMKSIAGLHDLLKSISGYGAKLVGYDVRDWDFHGIGAGSSLGSVLRRVLKDPKLGVWAKIYDPDKLKGFGPDYEGSEGSLNPEDIRIGKDEENRSVLIDKKTGHRIGIEILHKATDQVFSVSPHGLEDFDFDEGGWLNVVKDMDSINSSLDAIKQWWKEGGLIGDTEGLSDFASKLDDEEFETEIRKNIPKIEERTKEEEEYERKREEMYKKREIKVPDEFKQHTMDRFMKVEGKDFVTQLDDVLFESKSQDRKALRLFAHQWNALARLDNLLPSIETTTNNYKIGIKYCELEDIMSVGMNWKVVSESEIEIALHGERVANAILNKINNIIQNNLHVKWDYVSGSAELSIIDPQRSARGNIGYSSIQDLSEFYFGDYDDDERIADYEKEFLSNIFEDINDTETYDKIIERLSKMGKEELADMESDDYIINRVLDLLVPERLGEKIESGKYVAKFGKDQPVWYGGELAYEKRLKDAERFSIDLFDAESEFPLDLFIKLSGHDKPGKHVAWANGYIKNNVLAIIEIQSDIVRNVPEFLVKKEEYLERTKEKRRINWKGS